MKKVCAFGDSVFAGIGSYDTESTLRLMRMQHRFDFDDLSLSATDLGDALVFWNDLSMPDKESYDTVIIAGYFNNLSPVGNINTLYLDPLRDLMDQIRLDNSTVKIVLLTPAPFKSHWDDTQSPSNAAALYALWLLVVEALKGEGPNAVAADAHVFQHTDYLNDGTGGMKAPFWLSVADKFHMSREGKDVVADSVLGVLIPLDFI